MFSLRGPYRAPRGGALLEGRGRLALQNVQSLPDTCL